jgi:hypothetical protein
MLNHKMKFTLFLLCFATGLNSTDKTTGGRAAGSTQLKRTAPDLLPTPGTSAAADALAYLAGDAPKKVGKNKKVRFSFAFEDRDEPKFADDCPEVNLAIAKFLKSEDKTAVADTAAQAINGISEKNPVIKKALGLDLPPDLKKLIETAIGQAAMAGVVAGQAKTNLPICPPKPANQFDPSTEPEFPWDLPETYSPLYKK